MADYKKEFENWQRSAKEKFEEIDKQLGLKDKFEEGAKTLKETAQKGAETFKEGVEKIKAEAEKSDVGKQAVKIAEETFKTAEATAKKTWEASEPLRDAAGEASVDAGDTLKTAADKASEVFGDAYRTAETTAHRAANILGLGASWTRTIDAAIGVFQKTTNWIAEKPLHAAATGISVVVGGTLGAGFTLVSSHWFFNSALPFWGVKKVSEQFQNYLVEQQELIAHGELSQADAERIEFEREIVKYVGAPLLGAFSCGAGAMMWANMFDPKTITGAPISWIIGGNPVLEGIWLFGNGLVCFKTGYEFFMVSLKDQQEVQRIVRELKGLLPQTVSAG